MHVNKADFNMKIVIQFRGLYCMCHNDMEFG